MGYLSTTTPVLTSSFLDIVFLDFLVYIHTCIHIYIYTRRAWVWDGWLLQLHLTCP